MGHGPYGRGDYGVGLYGADESAEFPQGALRSAYEMLIDGSWVDVTPLVMTTFAPHHTLSPTVVGPFVVKPW